MILGRKFVKTVGIRDLGVIICKTQRRIQNAFKHLRYSFFENKFNGYEPLTIFAKKAILEIFNEFVPNAPFLYLLKKNDKAQSPLW